MTAIIDFRLVLSLCITDVWTLCLDYAMSSDTSAASDLAYRRTCDHCKTRMSSLLHDRHSICSDRILTFGIRSICSTAKVGIGNYKAVNYQPGS